MSAFMHITRFKFGTAAFASATHRSLAPEPKSPRNFGIIGFVLALALSFSGLSVQAQTSGMVNCVIASNDGRNGFRTDEISGCRIDRGTGTARFIFKQEERSRSYDAVEPLTTRHLEAATYWLNRVGQLRFPASTNPAAFDPQAFLQAASQATHGFVLVRNKKSGGSAVNVVYITNGVYRSIDFSGTDLRDMPSGLLTTQR